MVNKKNQKNKTSITLEEYDCFKVYQVDEYRTFIHFSLGKRKEFYKKLFDYFFTEEKLLRYTEHRTNLQFEATRQNYCTLYKHLQLYMDEKNMEKAVDELNEIVLQVLADEEEIEDKNGVFYVKKDKIGKIGEYIFSCLLYDYYQFDCIIPKISLLTDPNMNVYGIDTLFYSSKENLLMFGESKVSKALDNGINLIKESLKDYERQLRQEFLCVLSSRTYKDKLYRFTEIYGDKVEISLTMDQFIKEAQITKIGIPIFIAHGTETEPGQIIQKLRKISVGKILGIGVSLVAISLPIIDKRECITYFTEFLRERIDLYETKV